MTGIKKELSNSGDKIKVCYSKNSSCIVHAQAKEVINLFFSKMCVLLYPLAITTNHLLI